MMSVKLVFLGLFKIKAFQNKGYDVTIFANSVINEILSRDTNCIVDLVMWPNFGNCSISAFCPLTHSELG